MKDIIKKDISLDSMEISELNRKEVSVEAGNFASSYSGEWVDEEMEMELKEYRTSLLKKQANGSIGRKISFSFVAQEQESDVSKLKRYIRHYRSVGLAIFRIVEENFISPKENKETLMRFFEKEEHFWNTYFYYRNEILEDVF